MENIHAPTVPSGPSSRPLTNGNAKQLSFAELHQKKESMEAELKALGGVLDSVGHIMIYPVRLNTDKTSAWRQYGHSIAHAGWISPSRH